MAKVSWGWNLVHHSPLRWQRTCWRPHSSFLRLKKYIFFSAIAFTWQDSESVLRGTSIFHFLYCRLAETSLRPRSGFDIRWIIELATFFECLYFQLAKLNFNSHFASLQAWISSPVFYRYILLCVICFWRRYTSYKFYKHLLLLDQLNFIFPWKQNIIQKNSLSYTLLCSL